MKLPVFVVPLILLAMLSCSSTPQPAPPAAFKIPDLPAPVADNVKFPTKNRTSIEVVPKALLGFPFLAGGNVAAYVAGKQNYKLFSIRCRSAEQAGSYLFAIKGEMKDPRFVASYGGYFSDMPEGPLFVFAKGSYIGGIFGLPEEEAVVTGTEFAARL